MEFRPIEHTKENVQSGPKEGDKGKQPNPKSPNKFSILEEANNDVELETQSTNEKDVVDKYVKFKRQPTLEESHKWSQEMFKYFKDQWEAMWNKEGIKVTEVEDVCEDTSGMAQQMVANELDGIAKCITVNELGELGA